MQAHTVNIARSRRSIHALLEQSTNEVKAGNAWPGTDSKAPWRWAEHHLNGVFRLLRQYTIVDGVLGESAQHQLTTSVSKLRARLTLATSHCFGVDVDSAIYTATACELLYYASLIRDDLRDKSYSRCGQPTIWHKYGSETAVALGDLFLIQSYAVLADTPCETRKRSTLSAAFSRAAACTLTRQSNDFPLPENSDATLESYEDAAMTNPGTLLALPVQSALILADVPLKQISSATKVLKLLGVARQITDEVNELLANNEIGELGLAFNARKLAAPAIFYLRVAPPKERNAFLNFLHAQTQSNDTNSLWVETLRNSNALQECQRHVEHVQESIKHQLDSLPPRVRNCLNHGIKQTLSLDDRLRYVV